MGRRVLLAVGLAAALMAASAPGARAATDFYSSFESGDPAPTWVSTPEGTKSSGVTGPAQAGVPGDITATNVGVTASAENTPDEVAGTSPTPTPTASGWPSPRAAGCATSSARRPRPSATR